MKDYEDMLYKEVNKEMIKVRKYLHQIPEIGFKEFKTSSFIKSKLKEFGYEVEITAKTGIIAFIKGKTTGEAIAFRADMDGLMINEDSEIDFSSEHPGRMHACGHDGHMAVLLGLAMFLSRLNNINKDILLIFQPAEEGPGGANIIVNEGILDKYNVKYIFGLHIFPEIKEGKIGIASGPIMAQSGEFDIFINSKNSHGAMPHLGIDGIYISSLLIQSYQSIISRNIDPNETAVLTIGKISGGSARNIIAGKIKLEGTIRAFNLDIYNKIKSRIHEINKGIELMYHINIDTQIRDFYPPVINDKYLYNIVKKSLSSKEVIEMEPLMISEDFSYYQEKIAGFFFLLGSKNEIKGYDYPLHSSKFNFDEKILLTGLKTYIKILKTLKIT